MKIHYWALVVSIGIALPVHAEFVTPAGLSPGDSFRIVFLSDGLIDGTAGTVAPYDALVAQEASAANLGTYFSNPVTWRAIVSVEDGTEAADRLPPNLVPIYLLDGTLVALSGEKLWLAGSPDLSHAIDLTASGTTALSQVVWTGTTGVGLPVGFGTLGGQGPFRGNSSAINSDWVGAALADPATEARLYGFSSVLTVPAGSAAPVPEPATLTLLTSGTLCALGIFACLRKRARQSTALRGGPSIAK